DFAVGIAVGGGFAGLLGAFSGYWALAGLVAVIAPTVLAYCWAIEKVRLAIAKPELRGRPGGAIESLLSREFAFVLNNWILTGMLLFVLVATTFPLISEAVRGETVTV